MFYADLHVHSKFSRATSRDCDLEHLALWAGRKGISVVGTGDFTHPGWFHEIEEKLIPAEPGLFRLRPDLQADLAREPGAMGLDAIRFLLQVEISTIYKKDERTRKVHHLIYVPSLDAARNVTAALARIGNLGSDGRPILGLDSRNLLEITLASGEGSFLIPAHVWTPWFAVLGSKSGFDSIEHCYADLSPEVFALETGLSSDPPMNWRLSALDRYTLVSNSDAHSPSKLGREACVFDTDLDYFALRRSLATGEGYHGTVEFFPEEGKYYLDGHRTCGVCLEPEETRRHGGKCPVCGKPLTLGVMYRVCELADRPEPPDPLPPKAAPFRSLVPLCEVLSEVLGVGPDTKTVRQKYDDLLTRLGPELFILERAPLEDLARAGSPILAESLRRMRKSQVIRQGGYDGEYGVIRLLTEEERMRRTSVSLLFDLPEEPAVKKSHDAISPLPFDGRGAGGEGEVRKAPPSPPTPLPQAGKGSCDSSLLHNASPSSSLLTGLDPQQRTAAEAITGPVLIVAGPGTGKTRTLTHRLAHLIADHHVPPEQCLALTFSRRAAAEMVERLEHLLPDVGRQVPVMTFHALGLTLLREFADRLGLGPAMRVAGEAERTQLLMESLDLSEHAAGQLLTKISRRKRRPADAPSDDPPALADAIDRYHRELHARDWVDFDDLIIRPLELLQNNPDLVDRCRSRYPWVSIDEYQDIDASQYALVRLLVPADGNLCAIGDPDQAIYGFRGADVGYFQRFREEFPAARTIHLERNYRSTQTIVDAALQAIAPASLVADRRLAADGPGAEQIEIHGCSSDRAEAELVVHTIERALGGSAFFSLDSSRVASHEGESYSFNDFAVLYRTESQADVLAEALGRSGMPFQRRSHAPLGDQPLVQSLVQAVSEKHTGEESVSGLLEVAATAVTTDEARPVLDALRSLAARHGSDMAGFLSELALGIDADLWDPRADRISLLTLHAAKGLEFPVVFVVGCEDGVLPLHWGSPEEEALAEERRLLFVGMTRARQRLVLTHARKRRWRGAVRPMDPSPFLDAIERRLLDYQHHRATKKPSPVDRQRTLFE